MTAKFTTAVHDLKGEMKALHSSNMALKAELTSVRASMDFINESFEEFKSEIKALRSEVNEVKTRTHDLQQENQKLNKELKEVNKELVELKQYGRKNNIELKGLPASGNEDLRKTIQAVAKSLQIEHASSEIDVVHRVPTRGNGPANIVVKFVSRSTRDRFLQAAKKNRLNASMIGFEENTPVFINEHLCRENKILLGKAIQAKRENNWKFAWVSDGKILMRKAENTRVVQVTCEEDLAKIV
ncbi:hypothetical protein HPB50_007566 [Hyalomma asiaticum]|uniref:Uncharacterized protein n=1 Tax=Hyalomma asiaticum TaxID=266040 RepID=A0ACB7TGH4_HYAAI|nr:hypothetical protein HPB50_007566 [Hyalomma asiaticum]